MVLSRLFAEIYDGVFDSFNQNEDALAQACVMALLQYHESDETEEKQEIIDLLLEENEKDRKEGDHGEMLSREILLDEKTWYCLECIKTSAKYDCVVSIFVTGIIMVHVMQKIITKRPTAGLIVDSRHIPISKILNGKPQSLN